MAKRVFTQAFVVVGAIIEKDKKILLVKEGSGTEKGKWNQPAGWIELGEDPTSCVIREVKEETGLDFEPSGLIGVYSLVNKYLEPKYGATPHPVKLIFRGRISGELINSNDEIMEVRWFALEDIEKMSRDEMRDMDIVDEIKDYFAGRCFPLDIIRHNVIT